MSVNFYLIVSFKVHESPPPYSDTSHENLPDVIMSFNRNISNETSGTSQTNEATTISIISNIRPQRDSIPENKIPSDDNKGGERAIHM